MQHFLSIIAVGRRSSSFNHLLTYTCIIFYTVMDCINSWCCLLYLFVVMNLSKVFVCLQHTSCPWWITSLSFGLSSSKALPEVGPQHYTSGLSFSVCWMFMFVCVCVSSLGRPGVWGIKALLGQSSIVNSSDPLNSVGLVYEREGRCSTFHVPNRGALCLFFSYSSLSFQQLLFFFLLF